MPAEHRTLIRRLSKVPCSWVSATHNLADTYERWEVTMTYGIIASVPMPIDMYRAVSAAVTEQMGERVPAGLLAHVSRQTPDGFQVIEVWESKKQCDDFQDTVLAPIIDRVSGGQAPPRESVQEDFDVEEFFVGGAANS
jgi:hypothetical protein